MSERVPVQKTGALHAARVFQDLKRHGQAGGPAQRRPAVKSLSGQFLEFEYTVEPGMTVVGILAPELFGTALERNDGVLVQAPEEYMTPGDPAGLPNGACRVVDEFQCGDEGHGIELVVLVRKVFGEPLVDRNPPAQALVGDTEHRRRRINACNAMAQAVKPVQEDTCPAPHIEHSLGGRGSPHLEKDLLFNQESRTSRFGEIPVVIMPGVFNTKYVAHEDAPCE